VSFMKKKKDNKEVDIKMEAELQAESAVEPSGEPVTGPSEEPVVESSGEPAVSLEDIENLKNELNDMRIKADEYLDGWQRARADFANYKKRVERDQAQVYQMAVGGIVKRYLDVLDDLERALNNKPTSGEGATWAEGIELIYRKLLGILEAEGVQQMDADGQFFDPNLHEAISQENSPEHESGQIIEVIQQGYLLGERVIRPALVRVAG
jgi:molecular chaperone GrpE